MSISKIVKKFCGLAVLGLMWAPADAAPLMARTHFRGTVIVGKDLLEV